MYLGDIILPLYHVFCGSLSDLELPDEYLATCEECPYEKSPDSPYAGVKCCNYHPHLPNYLVGAVLSDNQGLDEEGRGRVPGKIKEKAGVTPYGIIPPLPVYRRAKEYKAGEFWLRTREDVEAQLCPYYFEGRCSIWSHRNSVCMTFFCSSSGGLAGHSFWGTVCEYLAMTEKALSQHALLKMGWPQEKINTDTVNAMTLGIDDEHGGVVEERYLQLWGEWAGREEEFFRGCYKVVRETDRETFLNITGIRRIALEEAVKEKQSKFMSQRIPRMMMLDSDVVTENGKDGMTRLVKGGRSAEVPSVVLPLIRGFNGRHSTLEIFHQAIRVMYNMTALVDELLEKGMLKSFGK